MKKSILIYLLFSTIIISIISGCKPHNSILDNTTTPTSTNKKAEKKLIIDYSQQIINFLKDPEVVTYVKEYPFEPGFGGPSYGLLDITGDDIPEILSTTLKGLNYPNDVLQITTAFDINTHQPLLTFYGGSRDPSFDYFKRYKDTDGVFKCLVFDDNYLGNGNHDTIITEITSTNKTLCAKTKIAVRCWRQDTDPFEYNYDIFTDLSDDESKVFRYWLDPTGQTIDRTIYDLQNPVENIKEMSNIIESKTYNKLVSSLTPLETNYQEIGGFPWHGSFVAMHGFEHIYGAIKELYNLKDNS